MFVNLLLSNLSAIWSNMPLKLYVDSDTLKKDISPLLAILVCRNST